MVGDEGPGEENMAPTFGGSQCMWELLLKSKSRFSFRLPSLHLMFSVFQNNSLFPDLYELNNKQVKGHSWLDEGFFFIFNHMERISRKC